jgi:hypothetical protein
VSDLETLQELILAAKADGDDETADWLASIADDPEQVAAVVRDDSNEGERS